MPTLETKGVPQVKTKIIRNAIEGVTFQKPIFYSKKFTPNRPPLNRGIAARAYVGRGDSGEAYPGRATRYHAGYQGCPNCAVSW